MDASEQEWDAESAATDPERHSNLRNSYRERRARLFNLTTELSDVRESLIYAEGVAGAAVMVLRGDAGTGKTHLLCDIAEQRVATGRPTVLLMGQRFLSNDTPWSQALQQLDMTRLSAEEFIGALEAAAQAADSRALLLIDALIGCGANSLAQQPSGLS